MILLIDNYDSFTYNLVQYIKSFEDDIHVVRNDQVTIDEIKAWNPRYIVLSPGPGNPNGAGICLDVVKQFQKSIPILGVCLGHQIIAQALGANIIKAFKPMHGKVCRVHHDGETIFRHIPVPFSVTRYHSLVVEPDSLPEDIVVSARSEVDEIMAIRHRKYRVEGVQFHPESIRTEYGFELLKNFFEKGVE